MDDLELGSLFSTALPYWPNGHDPWFISKRDKRGKKGVPHKSFGRVKPTYINLTPKIQIYTSTVDAGCKDQPKTMA